MAPRRSSYFRDELFHLTPRALHFLRPPNFSTTIARMAVFQIRSAASANEELTDRCRDLGSMRFQSEVPGVKEAHICVRYVAFECLRTSRQEERIVLAPHCQKRRLVLAKIGLEFGIQRDVALVVAEQVELHFIGARS